MVTPRPDQTGQRVRVVRDKSGRVVGFQDPDKRNIFISRADAIPRLRYSVDRQRVEDSFKNEVGVGALGLPGRGVSVAFKTKQATYQPLPTDPTTYTPRPNQEIVERTVFIDRDGKLVSSETSYGLGKKYDPTKAGGRWRRAASKAVGAGEGQRLPTRDLKRAVAHSQFLVKDISG